MRFKELIIENFGPYVGRNSFNLRTNPEEPIVLFGGRNGAGKTTIFNSIQLCLHGQSAFGKRVSRSDYESKIYDRLHESNGAQATEGSVTLKFEYGNFGTADDFLVTRSWRDRGKSLKEEVVVKRNGRELDGMDRDQWESFLKELLPPGISQLFFFDGEKIQQLATAIEDGSEFEKSLFSLLGLDLVDRLDSDLSIYISQKLDESGYEEIAKEIQSLREDKQEFEEELRSKRTKISKKRQRIEDINQEIEEKENELAQEGGGFARKRDSLKDRRATLDEEIESLNESIRGLAKGSYPFALAPELCQDVTERLKNEERVRRRQSAKEEVLSTLDEIDEDITFDELDIPEEASGDLIIQVKNALNARFEQEASAEYSLSKEFSEREREEMYKVVDKAINDVPNDLQDYTDALEKRIRERQDVQQKLSQAPEQSVISPIVQEINALTESRGKLKEEITNIEDDLEVLENKITRASNSLEKRLEEQEELDKVSDQRDLASRTRKAVQDYRDRLVKSKLEQLESALTERYLSISNKNNYYDRVIVDPDEISISIQTKSGDKKHQSQLSAGERQIFATALLWALAEISGRPLPFLIDTPLGRLDLKHRQNLVENFFPEASHQVILFSTDTEITEEYYEMIQDDIASEYLLDYQQDEGHTQVKRGYFWSDIVEPQGEQYHSPTSQQPTLGGFADE